MGDIGRFYIAEVLLVYLGVFAIGILITYFVIQAATKTKRRFKYEILRTKLLMKIAEKNGVSSEEIEQLVKEELSKP